MLTMNVSAMLFFGVAISGWLVLVSAFVLYMVGHVLSRYHADEELDEPVRDDRLREAKGILSASVMAPSRSGRIIPFPSERIRA